MSVECFANDLCDHVRRSVEHVLIGSPAGRLVLGRVGLGHRGPPRVRVPDSAVRATAARARSCIRRRRSARWLAAARCRSGSPCSAWMSAGSISSWRASSSMAWAHGVQRDQACHADSRVLGDDVSAAPAPSPASRGALEQLQRNPHWAGVGGGSRGWLRTGHGRLRYHGSLNHDTVTVRCERDAHSVKRRRMLTARSVASSISIASANATIGTTEASVSSFVEYRTARRRSG